MRDILRAKEDGMLFAVHMTCCGRDEGTTPAFESWDDADAFRESYLSGQGVGPPTETRFGSGGHSRSAIIVEAVTE